MCFGHVKKQFRNCVTVNRYMIKRMYVHIFVRIIYKILFSMSDCIRSFEVLSFCIFCRRPVCRMYHLNWRRLKSHPSPIKITLVVVFLSLVCAGDTKIPGISTSVNFWHEIYLLAKSIEEQSIRKIKCTNIWIHTAACEVQS